MAESKEPPTGTVDGPPSNEIFSDFTTTATSH